MAIKSIEDIVRLPFCGLYPELEIDLREFKGDSRNILSTPFDEDTQGIIIEAMKAIQQKRYDFGLKGKKRNDLISCISEGNEKLAVDFSSLADSLFSRFFAGKELKERPVNDKDAYKIAIIDMAHRNGVYQYNKEVFENYKKDRNLRQRFRGMPINLSFAEFKSNPRDRKNNLVAYVKRIKSVESDSEKISRKLVGLFIDYLEWQQKFKKNDSHESFVIRYDNLMITDNEGILIANTRDEDVSLSPFMEYGLRIVESKSDIQGGRLNKQTKFFNPATGRFVDFHNYNIGLVGDGTNYVNGGWFSNEFFFRKFSLQEINDIIKHNINRNFKGVPHEAYKEWKLQELFERGKKLSVDLKSVYSRLQGIIGSILSECYFPSISKSQSRIYGFSYKEAGPQIDIDKVIEGLDAKKIAKQVRDSPVFSRKKYKVSSSRVIEQKRKVELNELIHEYSILLDKIWVMPVEDIVEQSSHNKNSSHKPTELLNKKVRDCMNDSLVSVCLSDSYFGADDYGYGKDKIMSGIDGIVDIARFYHDFCLPMASELEEINMEGSIEKYDEWLSRSEQYDVSACVASGIASSRLEVEKCLMCINGFVSIIGSSKANLTSTGKKLFIDKAIGMIDKAEGLVNDSSKNLPGYYKEKLNSVKDAVYRARSSLEP